MHRPLHNEISATSLGGDGRHASRFAPLEQLSTSGRRTSWTGENRNLLLAGVRRPEDADAATKLGNPCINAPLLDTKLDPAPRDADLRSNPCRLEIALGPIYRGWHVEASPRA
jgi:hypothetical protein